MGIVDAAEALGVEMSRGIVVVLKAIVAVIVAAILVSQVWLIPLMANSAAEDLPEYAWMELPLLVLVEVALICVQSIPRLCVGTCGPGGAGQPL